MAILQWQIDNLDPLVNLTGEITFTFKSLTIPGNYLAVRQAALPLVANSTQVVTFTETAHGGGDIELTNGQIVFNASGDYEVHAEYFFQGSAETQEPTTDDPEAVIPYGSAAVYHMADETGTSISDARDVEDMLQDTTPGTVYTTAAPIAPNSIRALSFPEGHEAQSTDVIGELFDVIQWSIETWVELPVITETQVARIFLADTGIPEAFNLQLLVTADGGLRLQGFDNAANPVQIEGGTGAIDANAPHHLVVTCDGETNQLIRLYIDGDEVAAVNAGNEFRITQAPRVQVSAGAAKVQDSTVFYARELEAFEVAEHTLNGLINSDGSAGGTPETPTGEYPQGALAYFPMDAVDATGDTVDAVGGVHLDGAFTVAAGIAPNSTGAVTQTEESGQGASGEPIEGVVGLAQWSLESWVRFDNNDPQLASGIFGLSYPPDGSLSVQVDWSDNSVYIFSAEGTWVTDADVLTVGTTHHYVLTYTGHSYRFYIDGELRAEELEVGSFYLAADSTLYGAFGDATQDNLALYGRVLNPTQIAEHTANGPISMAEGQ